MGSVGDAYDDAMCESFFATLECGLRARRRFKSQAEGEIAVFDSSKPSIIGVAFTQHSTINLLSNTKKRQRLLPET